MSPARHKSAIVSYGSIDSSAKETYGSGPVIVSIGNGGAGATGLIRALAEDFLSTASEPGSIQWVCNHSRNTQLALLHGYVDIALTYERDQEALAEQEGWSKTIGCVFHDHFVLAGPVGDPAGIAEAPSLGAALTAIATKGSLFHSRADSSATMWKERSLWQNSSMKPWNDSAADWYKQSHLSPAEAVIAASKAGAYLITDRSTLLRQTSLQTISGVTVFFEPDSADHILMNSCYALVSQSSKALVQSERGKFLEYLISPRGQDVIGAFGKDSLGGYPLFASVVQSFARTFLRGGEPSGGIWKPGVSLR